MNEGQLRRRLGRERLRHVAAEARLMAVGLVWAGACFLLGLVLGWVFG